MTQERKRVLFIGGPNGAGKTTAAMTLLPRFLSIHEFINADEIAHGLNPLNPDGQAVAGARLMIQRLRQLMRQGKSFALEGTCAGRGHLAHLTECRKLEYEIILVFLWLPNAEMAIRRVAQRVKQEGHDIPPDVIRRRYAKGLQNLLSDYLPLADYAEILDSSANTSHNSKMPFIIRKHGTLEVLDQKKWEQLRRIAHE